MWPKCCLIWQVFGPWASPYGANGQIIMTLHNYKSRQVHETSNGGKSIQWFQRYAFRKVWTQFVPNLTSFWPMGKPIWGKWANDHDSANYRPRQFHRTSNGENPSSSYRYMGSASLTAARSPGPWRQYPSSPEGWGVKNLNAFVKFRFMNNTCAQFNQEC